MILGIVYGGESLLTMGSQFLKLRRTPPAFKGTMTQKIDYASIVLFTKKMFKVLKL
jgi:hypothetical protein